MTVRTVGFFDPSEHFYAIIRVGTCFSRPVAPQGHPVHTHIMKIEPVSLIGPTLRLEPQSLDHTEGLCAVTELDVFDYHPTFPQDDSLPAFREYMVQRLATPGLYPFTIFLRETNQPVGSSCYMDVRPKDRGLEIGGTWIGKRYQGSQVNPESKYLMLRHAFEELGAIRVQLKTDGRNLQSQRAIAKLGAVHEGVLRKHLMTDTGYLRDTVMYSILDTEWPEVKQRLERRLGWGGE